MIFLSSGTGKILRICNPGLLTAKILSAICRRVETREERKERRKREKAEQVAYKLEQVRSLYRDVLLYYTMTLLRLRVIERKGGSESETPLPMSHHIPQKVAFLNSVKAIPVLNY